MSDFIKDWFKWFEKGMANLDQESKEKFFSECGANCVNRGAINRYQKLFIDSENSFDKFFLNLSQYEGISGIVNKSGTEYELTYSSCTCELHKQGYINSNCICECSRQSIIHVLKTLSPNSKIEVEILSTILSGYEECRFLIKVV